MRLLYDAVLPPSLALEARPAMELHRWDGADEVDTELVRAAANRGYRGVIFFEQSSLEQPGLRQAAAEVGVALVAVKAEDPIEAKQRILRNMRSLCQALHAHDCILVLSNEVRSMDDEADG